MFVSILAQSHKLQQSKFSKTGWFKLVVMIPVFLTILNVLTL